MIVNTHSGVDATDVIDLYINGSYPAISAGVFTYDLGRYETHYRAVPLHKIKKQIMRPCFDCVRPVL